MSLPISDHPHFLILPVWEPPGILRCEQPHNLFTGLSWIIFYHVPSNIRDTLGLEEGEQVHIVLPDHRVDVNQFARALAKIAYCQAVARFNIDGFRRLALPDLIFGKYSGISYFVGSTTSPLPPPPEPRGSQHRIITFDHWFNGGMRLLIARIRLFADSGTAEHGTPIYTVVVGAPNALTKGGPD